jgi:DNA-binding XRE family transcriptional regulator
MRIRSDHDLSEAQERLAEFRAAAARARAEAARRGLPAANADLAAAPQETMADELAWEIDLYERLRKGDLAAVPEYPPQERGKALICLRILRGWTQRELAQALGVSEAVVSRDETHEYHGLSLEKYAKVLRALGFEDRPHFVAAGKDPSQAQLLKGVH